MRVVWVWQTNLGDFSTLEACLLSDGVPVDVGLALGVFDNGKEEHGLLGGRGLLGSVVAGSSLGLSHGARVVLMRVLGGWLGCLQEKSKTPDKFSSPECFYSDLGWKCLPSWLRGAMGVG